MLDKFFKILSYEEVHSFGKAQRNRKVKKNHVNDFVNVIKDGKSRIDLEDGTYLVFGIIPIIVNPITGNILEGQHRHAAFMKAYDNGLIDKNARLLVGYWEIDDPELENIITIELNSKTKNWSLDDYMASYAQYLENYARLKLFCETHSLCNKPNKSEKAEKTSKYRYGAAIITGKGQSSNLKAGVFSFTEEQLAEAETIHKEMVDIRKKLGLPIYATGNEVEAMAIEWHTQRKFISASDIKALTYIPVDVRERQLSNKSDWNYVFCRLKDAIQKVQLRAVAVSVA